MEQTKENGNNFPLKKWISYNFVGWLLGTILVLILSSSFDALGIHGVQFFVALGIGMGVGTFQWLILRKFTGMGTSWILFTMIGLSVPFILADILKYLDLLVLQSLLIPVCVTLGSLLVGYLQSRLLKTSGIDPAHWIGVIFLSWLLIALAVLCVQYTHLISSNVWFGFTANLTLLLSGGVILGILTGRYLRKNLERP